MPGINGNVTGSLLEEVRPVHVFSMFVETDFWLYLIAQVNKYVVRTIVQNDGGYSNSGMESKWFDTTVGN
jgi:3-deoxy-D-manno-octulosonic-acid transferase